MKIDFRKITVKDVDGKEIILDIAKELGRGMYINALEDPEMHLGSEIHDNGEVEVNKARALILEKYIRENYRAFVKASLIPMLDDIIEHDDINN